jgi:5-methylcytosine-specific restriction endonuclease McrA
MIRINVMTQKIRNLLYGRRFKERHFDKCYEYNRQYRLTHPGIYRKSALKYSRANPEVHRQRALEWYKANRDRGRKKARAYALANPGRRVINEHNRRARILGNGGTFTAAEWQTLKRQYGFRCVGCWKIEAELKLLGRTLTPDHIVPLVKGGMNIIENLQPLCHGQGGCNNSKGSQYLDFIIS